VREVNRPTAIACITAAACVGVAAMSAAGVEGWGWLVFLAMFAVLSL
jgi:hypothetical protein